jgi:hypothetical protein
MWISELTLKDFFEVDELYHFIKKRPRTETRENTYVIPLISRTPRQILNFAVDNSKSAKEIQPIVDNAPHAWQYNTDGYHGYLDVVFSGYHRRSVESKKHTHNIESVNADLRHYIPGLRRRSRCFYRSLETLRAVLSVFANAYNKFGEAKLKYRRRLLETYGNVVKYWNSYRDPPISIYDYI